MHHSPLLAPFLFGFLVTLACNSGGNASADGDSGSTSPSSPTTADTTVAVETTTGDDLCIPGYETCPCVDGEICLDGLTCYSGLCVLVPTDTSDESSGEGTTAAAESSSGDAPGDSSSGAGESSSGGEPSCFEGDTYCAAGTQTFQECIDGEWQASTCAESCLTTGHTGTDCAPDQQGCTCDGFADADCELDMQVLCYCYFEDLLGDACTDDQTEQFYQWCYQDTDPVVACFGSYYDPGGSGLDCDGAIANCL